MFQQHNIWQTSLKNQALLMGHVMERKMCVRARFGVDIGLSMIASNSHSDGFNQTQNTNYTFSTTSNCTISMVTNLQVASQATDPAFLFAPIFRNFQNLR